MAKLKSIYPGLPGGLLVMLALLVMLTAPVSAYGVLMPGCQDPRGMENSHGRNMPGPVSHGPAGGCHCPPGKPCCNFDEPSASSQNSGMTVPGFRQDRTGTCVASPAAAAGLTAESGRSPKPPSPVKSPLSLLSLKSVLLI